MSIMGGAMGMFGGSAFLNAAGSQHGNTWASRIYRPYQDFDTPWGKGPYTGFAKEGVRWRVEDAKAAGIHPLFAMGNAGVGATVKVPHRPQAAGGGGYSGGGGVTKNAERRAQEQHEQNMERGNVELMKSQSELRRMVQTENYKRPQNWPDDGAQGGGGQGAAKVYPFGTKRGLPLNRRPLEMTARRSLPMRTEVIADDGYRYRIIDPDTGDELSQMDLAQQIILRHTRKARKAPGRELKLQAKRMAAKIKRAYRKGLTSTRQRRSKNR